MTALQEAEKRYALEGTPVAWKAVVAAREAEDQERVRLAGRSRLDAEERARIDAEEKARDTAELEALLPTLGLSAFVDANKEAIGGVREALTLLFSLLDHIGETSVDRNARIDRAGALATKLGVRPPSDRKIDGAGIRSFVGYFCPTDAARIRDTFAGTTAAKLCDVLYLGYEVEIPKELRGSGLGRAQLAELILSDALRGTDTVRAYLAEETARQVAASADAATEAKTRLLERAALSGDQDANRTLSAAFRPMPGETDWDAMEAARLDEREAAPARAGDDDED